jgi:hypothetical protein
MKNKIKALMLLTFLSTQVNSASFKIMINSKNEAITIIEKSDKNGFNSEGLHEGTGTNYDNEGYDSEGYDSVGFNAEGLHKDTGSNYNPEGYDKEGYNNEGFNLLGIHKITGTNYNEAGFNVLGYDIDDFDVSGKGEQVCILNGENGNLYRVSSYQNSPSQYWGEVYIAFDYENVRVTGAAITYNVGVNGTPTMSIQTKAGITGYVLFNDSKYIYEKSTLYKTTPFSGFAGHSYYGTCRTKVER